MSDRVKTESVQNFEASLVKVIAIYLPQFHPIPENDAWWGKGFTEWRNVARAKPLFQGHYQPHIPGDLGFYDLRTVEVREEQAELARQHGIYGFCYFHYWFKGRRILERPFAEVLASGKPNFPFSLIWANQTWEGRWHGITEGRKVLIAQEYSAEDDLNHIRWLAEAMADPRYIRAGDRPIFTIYRPLELPHPRRTLDVWKSEMLRLGMPEPYIIAADSEEPGRDLTQIGFDATLQYLPQLGVLDCLSERTTSYRLKRLMLNLCRGIVSPDLHVFDYEYSVRKMVSDTRFPAHRSILPSWDNSPRSGKRGVILRNSHPKIFEKFLRELYSKTQSDFPADRRLMFINAWNEWAEGNYLEPDLKYGMGYLDAVKRVVSNQDVYEQESVPSVVPATVSQDNYVPLGKRLYWDIYQRLRRWREV